METPSNAPSVEQVLAVAESQNCGGPILNIYLWGSRVYGTASSTSDWDYNVIFDDFVDGATPNKADSRQFAHVDLETQFQVIEERLSTGQDINLTFIPLSQFIWRAQECRHDVLENLSSPKDCILLEKYPIKIADVLDVDILRRTATWQSKRRFHVASGALETLGLQSAKKWIFHSIRYLEFAIQIIQHGKIVDFQACKPLFHQIMVEETSESWNYYVEKYEPIRKDVSLKLQNLRSYRDITGPLEVHKRCWKILSELGHLNSEIPGWQITTCVPENDDLVRDISSRLTSTIELRRFCLQNNLVYVYDSKQADTIFVRRNPYDERKDAPLIRHGFAGVLLRISNGSQCSLVGFCFDLPIYSDVSSLQNDKTSFEHQHITDAIPFSLIPFRDDAESCHWEVLTPWGLDTHNIFPLGSRSERQKGAKSIRERFNDSLDSCWTKLPVASHGHFIVFCSLSSYRLINAYQQTDQLPCTLRGGWDLQTSSVLSRVETRKRLGLEDFITDEDHEVTQNPLRFCGELSSSMSRVSTKLKRDYVSICLGANFSQLGSLNFGANVDENLAIEIIRQNRASLWLQHFPEWETAFSNLMKSFDEMCLMFQETLNQAYEIYWSKTSNNTNANNASVAALLSKFWYKAILFTCTRDSVLSIREYLALCDDKTFSNTFNKFRRKTSQ